MESEKARAPRKLVYRHQRLIAIHIYIYIILYVYFFMYILVVYICNFLEELSREHSMSSATQARLEDMALADDM